MKSVRRENPAFNHDSIQDVRLNGGMLIPEESAGPSRTLSFVRGTSQKRNTNNKNPATVYMAENQRLSGYTEGDADTSTDALDGANTAPTEHVDFDATLAALAPSNAADGTASATTIATATAIRTASVTSDSTLAGRIETHLPGTPQEATEDDEPLPDSPPHLAGGRLTADTRTTSYMGALRDEAGGTAHHDTTGAGAAGSNETSPPPPLPTKATQFIEPPVKKSAADPANTPALPLKEAQIGTAEIVESSESGAVQESKLE